jgi:hypothetical protein
MRRSATRARDCPAAAARQLRSTNRWKLSRPTREDTSSDKTVSEHFAITTFWIACALCSAMTAPGQALPPPGDGDIRVLCWELTQQTDVWLTLELRTPEGKAQPTGMNMTFTLQFPGKRPPHPVEEIEVRVNAGFLWAPRVQLRFVLNGRDRLEMAPPGMVSLVTGSVSDYLPVTISVETLGQLARAKHIEGNALGLEFALTDFQRHAIRTFYERVLSDNPARFSQ